MAITLAKHHDFEQLVREVIEAYRDDRDADLSNLIDEGLRRNPRLFAFALASRAAQQEKQNSPTSDRT